MVTDCDWLQMAVYLQICSPWSPAIKFDRLVYALTPSAELDRYHAQWHCHIIAEGGVGLHRSYYFNIIYINNYYVFNDKQCLPQRYRRVQA